MRTGIRILRNFLYIYVIYSIWANIAIVDYLFDIGYRIRSTAVQSLAFTSGLSSTRPCSSCEADDWRVAH